MWARGMFSRLGLAVTATAVLLGLTAPTAHSATATLLKDFNPGRANGICCGYPLQLTNAAGTLFFGAYDGQDQHGGELWKSDGTRPGTVLVADTSPGEPYVDGTYPEHITAVGATVFFEGSDPTHGFELWKSDGKASGTTLVKDIARNNSVSWEKSSYPSHLTDVGRQLFFVADDAIHGEALWRSDGTATGTRRVSDAYPGEMVSYRGELLFRGFDSTHGWELWKSDGTVAGTKMVRDLYPGRGAYRPNGSWPRDFTELDGTLYFTAAEATHGRELWRTDGTAEGTKLVADIDPGHGGSGPDQLAAHAGTLFLAARDRSDAHGAELWRSNGKPGGTRVVKDINRGSEGSLPAGLTSVGAWLFFVADDGLHGHELWKSDGTATGTRLVKDIVPGKDRPYVAWLMGVGNTLFFSADDHTHGPELWSSNGTAAGTRLVRDIYPGSQRDGGYPTVPGEFRGAIFFWADDPTHGIELWKAVP